jgi:hypothetical protein
MDTKMFGIKMNDSDKRSFQKALDYCNEFSANHQAEIGVAEIALGAGLIAWGLQSGHIQMGIDVVASKLQEGGLSTSTIGSITGAGFGGIGGSILGSIGIVGLGSAIGIPALAVIGGSAAIFGMFGHEIGEAFSTPPGGFGDFFFGASIALVGAALMIDGARRVVNDVRILKLASKVAEGVIYLQEQVIEVVASSKAELENLIEKLRIEFEKIAAHPDAKSAAIGITSGATAATGAAIGGGLAASSVAVFGSHTLGGLALSLGLVSAPVWPFVAGGAVGVGLALGGWKLLQKYRVPKAADDLEWQNKI